ncbi:helix-turn-helix transcriptional regulator, partial [Listeria monocytogenes]|nr:helix-turn-helix domain-containing protein [Listeria monocytogenes]EGP9684086.1 helix-turn-helix transcriptional regulator [Listeria monocytogenes]HAK1429262.1 helix-turn-helix transcriptional regulator [Listeria monocytogenes]
MITKLKELRIENNLTYGDVATKVGISKEYYWMIENGERDGYTYNTAKKIASVFDKN